MINVNKHQFVKRTNQLYKIRVKQISLALIILHFIGLIIIINSYDQISDRSFFLYGSSIIPIFFINIYYSFLAIKCPRCNSKILWNTAKESDFINFDRDIAKVKECPSCHFKP